MKVRVPAAAPAVPPETGASSSSMAWSAAALCTLRADSGAMVEHSRTRVPGSSRLSRPPSPRYRPSTCRLAASSATDADGSLHQVEDFKLEAGLEQVAG